MIVNYTIKMKNWLLFILLNSAIFLGAHADEIRDELPVGTTFVIKHDFWIYEIQGRLPYGEELRYLMQTSTGGGIGSGKYKYTTTFPAGTRLEVVSLIKKTKLKWFYVVKSVNYKNSQIGNVPVVIAEWSMLQVPWGRRGPLGGQPIQTTRLDPDLFTDFVCPEK